MTVKVTRPGQRIKDTISEVFFDTSAEIKRESFLRVDGDSALAGEISSLTATVNGHTSSISTNASAISTLEGSAAASYVIRAKAGGGAGAFEIAAWDDVDGGPASKITLTGDEIEFNGLSVFGGALQSDNFIADTSGWQIKQNGDAQLNSLTVTGDMLSPNSVTKVYPSDVGSATLTTTAQYLTIEDIDFNDAVKDADGAVTNPIIVTVGGRIINQSSGENLKLTFSFERRLGTGSWVSCFQDRSIYVPSLYYRMYFAFYLELFSEIGPLGVDDTFADYDQYRMKYRLTTETGGSGYPDFNATVSTINDLRFTLKQLNK